jgi:hypothetical protein
MYLNTKLLRGKMPNVMMSEKEMTIDDENNEIKQIFMNRLPNMTTDDFCMFLGEEPHVVLDIFESYAIEGNAPNELKAILNGKGDNHTYYSSVPQWLILIVGTIQENGVGYAGYEFTLSSEVGINLLRVFVKLGLDKGFSELDCYDTTFAKCIKQTEENTVNCARINNKKFLEECKKHINV